MLKPQFAPGRALRAARKLAADPDDLPQVFTIVESLSGDTLARITHRMQRSEVGRRLIAARSDIVDRLADRAALARLPEGTLGRAYLAFVEKENISAEGIRAAESKGKRRRDPLPEPYGWVSSHLRDTHDLWHAATGYSGDVVGELALLAFILAQTWNPGIALILSIAWLKTYEFGGAESRRTIIDGYRRGRKAAWLAEQDWEAMLELPLADVRRRLSLGAPAVYTQIRSAEVKAAA